MLAARKRITFGAVVTALAVGLAGCSGAGAPGDGPAAEKGAHGAKKAPAAPKNVVRLIGDGSTAYTGAQPRLPKQLRLKPGQKPPQFVVFSWDGAGEDSQRLFSHFREVGRKYDATMTYFLSGVYLLPKEKARQYDPPQHASGSSDIGFNDTKGSPTPCGSSGAPGATATRSARTSTATSAARTVASAPGRSTSGRARSARPRRS